MSTLVVYASKHGATCGITERIAARLGEAGQEAEVRPVEAAGDLTSYEAFVVGSAVYAGHWQKEASAFVPAICAWMRVPCAHYCGPRGAPG